MHEHHGIMLTASIGLSHPALLWGTAAALLPVLIHLLLRPRPRRVRFPALALALMHRALASGQRAHRVRNILLMLLRASLLAMAALLLAGPTCAPETNDPVGSGPVACAVILDDSLSTRYRLRYDEPTTLLDQSRNEVLALLDQAQHWPAGSELALFRAGDPETSPGRLTASRAEFLNTLRSPAARLEHARPLGEAVQLAAAVLRSPEQPRRRLIVFTDGMASAWRDVQASALAGIPGLAVQVVTPATPDRANLGIGEVHHPQRIMPASAAIPFGVTVISDGTAGRCWLTLEQGEEILARGGPFDVPQDASRELSLDIPPQPAGPHAGTLRLEPEDLFGPDQAWHLTWQTGSQSQVWLITPPEATPEHDLSVLVIQNLLAPAAMERAQQRIGLRMPTEQEANRLLSPSAEPAMNTSHPDRPAMIVVFTGATLAPAARDAVLALVEAGATVLLTPASTVPSTDWPGLRSLLSEEAPEKEILSALTSIRWERGVTVGTEADGLLELTRCRVQRRLRLRSLRPTVRTLATYTDNAPAIVSRQLGQGRILAITTTPDPGWSDLGVRAAGLLTWLHRLVEEAGGSPTCIADFIAGESPLDTFPPLPEASLVYVARQGRRGESPTWVRLSQGVPQQPWPTDQVGVYEARTGTAPDQRVLYAVNWPREEFAPTPITRPELERILGTPNVRLQAGDDDQAALHTGVLSRLLSFRDGTGPLGLLLLVLFVVEMAVASRRSSPANATKKRPASQQIARRGLSKGDTTAST